MSRKNYTEFFEYAKRGLSAFIASVHFLTLGTPYAAHAQSEEEGPLPVVVDAAAAADDAPATTREAVALPEDVGEDEETVQGEEPVVDESGSDQDPTIPDADDGDTRPRTVQALPDGPAKNAVTPQAISLPNAEGSIEGMGESFTPNLSAGTGTFRVPVALPPGRAGVQPSLSLAYSTGGGNGPLGVGWSLQTPFIARQTDRGLPRYVDRDNWHPEEDRFIYNGGQELVPVDAAEAIALDGSAIPADLAGWQMYRARVEGAFMRFFRSPDGLSWVVQNKDGMRFDFGLLAAGDGPSGMVHASVDALCSEFGGGGGRIYRWHLTRMSDVHGSTVYYRYFADEGRRYLQDIHYVSPHSCATATPAARRACSEPLSSYARRVRLVYERRQDVFESYVSTWRIATALRVKRIEITSYDSTVGERTLVRRYHLGYDPGSFLSLLTDVQVEGRPDTWDAARGVFVGDRSVPEGALNDDVIGRLLPPMRFGYSAPLPTTDTIPGFGGVDGTLHQSPSSPNISVSAALADLFDVNSDGLPDLLVTDPARNRTADGAPAAGVYFNGFAGPSARPGEAGGFSAPVPMAIPEGHSASLSLANLNVNPMDADGDGRSDLLHMPYLRSYGYFSPVREADGDVAAVSPRGQGWTWARKGVVLPRDELDARIDFGADGERLEIVDVNNDHLVDVVRTTGTVMQTFLNLGWLPGGDGRFGSATYTGGGWELSTLPIESCVLHLGLPIDFADPEIRIADMNGDGIQDIVKLRQGRIAYWPGRGAGLWGAGPSECARGEGEGREVEMFDPPRELNAELESVYLSDVNMDGAADLVQVRFDDIDVWFSIAGQGFTERITIQQTPAAPGYARRIRFADIDGTGTTDIVYGTADNWRWIDPMGGQRPRLLTRVENGLGGLTQLEYGTSAKEYLRDLAEADSCRDSSCERFTWSRTSSGCETKFDTVGSLRCPQRAGATPLVTTVVTAVEESDQFNRIEGQSEFVKRTEYAYHDGYYEGIEQELRGFGVADAIEIGDDTHPTATTRTHFYQGRRPAEVASRRLADNPNEALKGRTYLTEIFDENGVYLSSRHATMTVRKLLDGLDRRAVSYAFVSRTDELRYDTGPFVPNPGAALDVTRVVREEAGENLDVVLTPADLPSYPREPGRLHIRGQVYAHIAAEANTVDNAGNTRRRTALGRVRGEFGELPGDYPPEEIVQVKRPALCNPEEYVWRIQRTFITGHGSSTPLADTTSSYTPLTCDLASRTTTASTPIQFDFGGSPPGYVQPSTQSLVSSSNYNAWGGAVESCAGGDLAADGDASCLRHSAVDYDTLYAQFPVSERITTGRDTDGSLVQLDTRARWDEGLSSLVELIDPNSLTTALTYDGVGRITSMTPPASHDVFAADDCRSRPVPLTRIRYELSDELGAPVNRIVTAAEQQCALGAETLWTHRYVDGLGRTRAKLSQAEGAGRSGATNPERWSQSNVVRFSARGEVVESYQPSFLTRNGNDPVLSEALAIPQVPSSFVLYDAFNRPLAIVAEDGSATRTVYHALSTDVWDPNDLDPSSPHYGTFATERKDGHGRTIDQILRNRQVGRTDLEYYRLWSDYRADNKLTTLTRAETILDRPRSQATLVTSAREHVTTRTFAYDTAGRRLSSSDPTTDSRDPSASAANKGWRYLFNRVGDLVAVRDPRGCGQDFFYDHAGRLVAEHYVMCGEAQGNPALAAEGVPTSAIGLDAGDGALSNADVRYYFDGYPSWASALGTLPPERSGVLGRATGVLDRGQRSIVAYDDRGNGRYSAKQLAVIPDASSVSETGPGIDPTLDALAVDESDDNADGAAMDVVYDATVYAQQRSFDHASRPRRMTILPFGGNDRTVEGVLSYNARSLPHSLAVEVSFGGGSFVQQQPVVDHIEYTRDGLMARAEYGASLNGPGPVGETFYDVRRRPHRMVVLRTPAGVPGPEPTQVDRPLDAVSVVADQTLLWDRSDNLIEVLDNRPGEEWAAGFRPQSYRVAHDALYRVAGVELDYTRDDGSRTPQDGFVDWRDEQAEVEAVDPMRQQAAPLLPAPPEGRVASLTYEYDWLANMVEWTDDAYQFYERSLGAIGNGQDEAQGRPSALRVASDLPKAPPTSDWLPRGGRGGYLSARYGESGNLVMLTVRAQCGDRDYAGGQVCFDPLTAPDARERQLETSCLCANEQHYQYRWDELNRLVEARRYDRTAGTGSWNLAARQRYRYDASNRRTLKETRQPLSSMRVALYPLPGDLERRGLEPNELGDGYTAALTPRTEDQYLLGGARLVWSTAASATGTLEADARVTVAIADIIGTSAAVVDLVSGVLTETSCYYPNGARESYRAPDGAEIGPEPEGFTGKEADQEVGLTYFGERYLVPRIGRWASPDPLWVHSTKGGEAANAYHYVSGNMLQSRDPLGLEKPSIEDLLADPELRAAWDDSVEAELVDPSGPSAEVHFERKMAELRAKKGPDGPIARVPGQVLLWSSEVPGNVVPMSESRYKNILENRRQRAAIGTYTAVVGTGLAGLSLASPTAALAAMRVMGTAAATEAPYQAAGNIYDQARGEGGLDFSHVDPELVVLDFALNATAKAWMDGLTKRFTSFLRSNGGNPALGKLYADAFADGVKKYLEQSLLQNPDALKDAKKEVIISGLTSSVKSRVQAIPGALDAQTPLSDEIIGKEVERWVKKHYEELTQSAPEAPVNDSAGTASE